MIATTQTRALLLLTGQLGQAEAAVAPLHRLEFDRVLSWLKRTRLKPADLLEPELLERLCWAPGAPVPSERLAFLLNRAAVLEAVLDRWQRSGLWVIGRDDPEYPRRMKRRLRDDAPLLLFGRGERSLLNRGGIAVVGGDGGDAAAYAGRFGARAAAAGLSTLSGLGSPVEEAAMLSSLSRGGFAVAVVPGGLDGQAADGRLRAAADRLVLVSEAEPDQASDGSTRCLYGLSDAALLVGVGRGSDRWADAVGAIEKEWVPHWVRAGDPEAGTLIRLGAHPVADEEVSPRALLSPPRPSRSSARGMSGFGVSAPAPQPVLAGFAERAMPFPPPPAGRGAHLRLVEARPRPVSPEPASPADPEPSFYELFGRRIETLLRSGPLGVARIAEALDLTRPQAEAWLLRAQGEARVRLNPATRLYQLP